MKGPLEGIKYFDLPLPIIIHSPSATFVPSLSEIDDLSYIISCLVLLVFFMDTLVSLWLYPWSANISENYPVKSYRCLFQAVIETKFQIIKNQIIKLSKIIESLIWTSKPTLTLTDFVIKDSRSDFQYFGVVLCLHVLREFGDTKWKFHYNKCKR